MVKPLQKLRAWQPTAIDVRKAGKCPNCHRNTELFYRLPDMEMTRTINGELHVDGGSYCPQCGFGNACSMPMDAYENAERLEGDT